MLGLLRVLPGVLLAAWDPWDAFRADALRLSGFADPPCPCSTLQISSFLAWKHLAGLHLGCTSPKNRALWYACQQGLREVSKNSLPHPVKEITSVQKVSASNSQLMKDRGVSILPLATPVCKHEGPIQHTDKAEHDVLLQLCHH